MTETDMTTSKKILLQKTFVPTDWYMENYPQSNYSNVINIHHREVEK